MCLTRIMDLFDKCLSESGPSLIARPTLSSQSHATNGQSQTARPMTCVCVPCRAVNWFTLTESAVRSPSQRLPASSRHYFNSSKWTAFAWQSRPEGIMNGPVKIVKSMICLSSSQRRHIVKLFNWILIADNNNKNQQHNAPWSYGNCLGLKTMQNRLHEIIVSFENRQYLRYF